MQSIRKISLALATSTLALLVGSAAHAQITGFGTGYTAPTGAAAAAGGSNSNSGSTSTFTLNDGNCCASHPNTTVSTDGSTLGLGNSGGYAYDSAFDNTTQVITNGFTTTFTVTPSTKDNYSEGFAFVIQNDPHGVYALGGDNSANGFGSSGYDSGHPITPAAAVDFQFDGRSGLNTTGGRASDGTTATGLDLTQPFTVALTYSGATTTLTELLTQGTSTYNASLTQDLVSLVGNTPYVGFTLGQGGSSENITISNFVFTPTLTTPEPSQTAALSLGVLGLVGLAARKRRASAC